MGGQLEIDPESLRQAGQALQDLADRLGQAWSQFSAQVQGMGDIFGDDMVGGLIGASYGAAHEIADGSYTQVVDGFGEFGDGLVGMADDFDEVEQDNTDLMSGVYGEG